jgi:hypothetical protein
VKAGVLIGLLVAGNFVWFRMLRTIRKRGFPMTFLNSAQDLRSYREIIADAVVDNDRTRFGLSLIALYVFLAAIVIGLILY